MSFTNGDIAKVDLRWDVDTIGMAANVFQCQCYQASPHNLSDTLALLDFQSWIEGIFDPMEPHIVVSWTVEGCDAYKKVGELWNLVGPVPVDIDTGSIGDPLPSGVAALIEVGTDLSRVQGKKYIGGLSEVGQAAGLWIAGVLAAMLQSAIAWSAQFQSLGDPETYWIPGVWSTKALGFKMFSPAWSTKDVPAYQRRRKAGVGA